MQDELAEQAALRERVKELTCLYALAQLADRPGISLEGVLQGTVELLPSAWQDAEVAAARVVLDGRPYATAGFREDAQTQSAAIMIDGQRRGRVDVVYTEPRPVRDEGPFLKEERNLIDAVARQLGLIIQRRKADEDAKRFQAQLRHADRLATIGQLAAGIAHEVNEPLGNILGFAQLAGRHAGLPEPAARDLEKVVASALHAREIVRKLMLFARQMPPQKTRISLNAVVEDGLGFLESRCAGNGVALVRKLSGSLPTVDADSLQVKQVLVNLVVNAIQAMPEGGVLTVATGASAGWAWLVVEDTGAGMSQEVLNQIFTPFFTTKDVNEGTGLGLPVVHGIVSAHNGTIRVQSAPGQGARFEIRLPVRTDTRMDVAAPREEDRAGDETA